MEFGPPSRLICVSSYEKFRPCRSGSSVKSMEPTNIAHIARAENGIETIQSFFTEAVAREIVADRGHAKVVTTTNVFALSYPPRIGQ